MNVPTRIICQRESAVGGEHGQVDWESKGYLRIIKDLELAEDHEDCVEMLAYIDRPGYPHWP